ncbi:MAG: hypothetical protein RR863_00155 [Erysipelotrichaceae bacterium]
MMNKLIKIVLCTLMVLTLSACGKKDEHFASKLVTSYLDQLKKGDMKKAAKISGETYDEKAYENAPSSDIEVSKLRFSKLSYKVKDEKLVENDGEAWVKITISNVNYVDVMNKTYELCTSDPTLITPTKQQEEEAIVKHMKEVIETNEMKHKTVKVKLAKNSKDKWIITNENKAFQEAILGL